MILPQDSYIFTFSEKTAKTRTVRQAYLHAGMVLRAKNPDLPRKLFDAWVPRTESPSLTLFEFHKLVEKLTRSETRPKYIRRN